MHKSTEESFANFQMRRADPKTPSTIVDKNSTGFAFIIKIASIEQKTSAISTAITRIDNDFQTGIGERLTTWKGRLRVCFSRVFIVSTLLSFGIFLVIFFGLCHKQTYLFFSGVSVAIACVAGYLRSIVWRAPDLKCHTQGLIASITPALGSSQLDTHPVVMGELWSGIKNNLASLAELESLPVYAQDENRMVIDLLMQSRLNNDNSEKLRAVRAALYWLRDYWQYICQEMPAYYAWNDVCCVLTGAPTDYTTRSYIISQINEFALYVSIHDPIYKMVHKGGRNV